MKFIAFWEFDPKDAAKVIEKFKKSELGLKQLMDVHHIGGQNKGFTIFETDDEQDIIDYMCYYSPELDLKIYPIQDSMKAANTWLEYHE